MLEKMSDYQHVTKLHEAFWEAETLYICTELCTGGTLADKIRTDGPTHRSTAARFLKTLADFANDCLYEGTATTRLLSPIQGSQTGCMNNYRIACHALALWG